MEKCKKRNPFRLFEETNSEIEYLLSIPKDQLALFAGIIDGDGYISIVRSDKKRGYVSISLKIGLVYKDLPMLESFQKLLKIGRIAGPYKNIKGQDTVYLIFNRTELQQVLYPLFIYHKIYFLTKERRNQYLKSIYCMESEEVKFKEEIKILETAEVESITIENPSNLIKFTGIPKLPQTAQEYLDLPFFNAWLVGFTISPQRGGRVLFLLKVNQMLVLNYDNEITLYYF